MVGKRFLFITNGVSGSQNSAKLCWPPMSSGNSIIHVCVFIYRTVWLWCAHRLQPQTMAPGGQPLSLPGLVSDWLHVISRFTGTNICLCQIFNLWPYSSCSLNIILRALLCSEKKTCKLLKGLQGNSNKCSSCPSLRWNTLLFSSHKPLNILWWALGIDMLI